METENSNHNNIQMCPEDVQPMVTKLAPSNRPRTVPTGHSTATTPNAKKTKSVVIAKTPLATIAGAGGAKTPVVTHAKSIMTPKTARPRTAGTPLSSTKSRSLAGEAKAQMHRDRAAKTAALKERWAAERQERVTEQAAKREAQQKAARDELHAIADKRRLNREREKRNIAQQTSRRNEQLKQQNDDRVDQAKKLREQELKRRRESSDLKQKILREVHEHEKELEQKKKEEEQSLLETRRVAFLEARNAVKESESNRRQSLVNRGKVANYQREISKKLEQDKLKEEKDMLEFRREAFIEKNEFEKDIIEDRRRSLVGRLDEWRAAKQTEAEAEKEARVALSVEADIKTQDWLDIQEYKKALADRERESLENRLQKWRDEKSAEAEERSREAEAEAMERELFAQECEDVMVYKEMQEASRRQSLAYRLAVGRRDRDWMEGVEANQAVVCMQERQLAMEDREDVTNFKKQLDDNRRASLSFRLQKSRKESQFDMGKYANEVQVRKEEHDITLGDVAAVHEYQQQQRDAERMDLAGRLVEAKRSHELDLMEHRRQLNVVHDILASRREDWIDTISYQKEEKANRRRSICLRLDSWRQEKIADATRKNQERMAAEEDAFFKQMDHEDKQAAKKKAKEEEIIDLQLGNFVTY